MAYQLSEIVVGDWLAQKSNMLGGRTFVAENCNKLKGLRIGRG